jgi:glycosyltransferase involved in cell wall biosynthesis
LGHQRMKSGSITPRACGQKLTDSKNFTVSIIIPSFNYARFLPLAIESVLNQTERCQVIVVDDGSTDESVSVLESYRARIEVILKENGGHASAVYAGFLRAKGNVIIILDSDDVLYRDCVETVRRYIEPGLSKLQFQLDTIDQQGAGLGRTFPRYPDDLEPDRILNSCIDTGWYICPCTTGNAWSRDFLKQVLPVHDVRFRNHTDAYLNVLAPLYGKVASVRQVLGSYRVHGQNFWAQSDLSLRPREHVEHELERQELLEAHAQQLGVTIKPDAVLNNVAHLEQRMLSLRFTPESHPAPGDSRLSLFQRSMWAIIRSWDLRPSGRIIWAGYMFAITVCPIRPLKRLLSVTRNPGQRSRTALLLMRVAHGRFFKRDTKGDSKGGNPCMGSTC